MTKKVELGRVVCTDGVNNEIANEDSEYRYEQIKSCVQRHQNGDWGDMDKEDIATNNEAHETDSGRLLSAYEKGVWRKLWVITEADRSVTTVLFPEEY